MATVFWVYGLLGSVVVSALGVFIDPGDETAMWVYSLIGILFSVYVTVATYRCANNCKSVVMARLVRVSTVVSVILVVPIFAYLYFTGELAAALGAMGEQ